MTSPVRRLAIACCALMAVWLAAERPASAVVSEGAPAPEFSLKDQNGALHKLSDYSGKWVVLAFYPADMSPGCTLEMRSLRDSGKELKALNAAPVAISVQDSESHARFCEAEKLTQTLLADTSKSTARAYGVLNEKGVANRVTFLINPEGKIARVLDKVNVQTHGQDVAAALKSLQQSSGQAATYVPRTRGVKALKPGEAAPLFSLPEAGSDRVLALSELRHGKKGVLVVWVSVQCPVSNAYQSRLKALAKKYGGEVAFVAINSNSTESLEQIQKHFQPSVLGFPVLRDVQNVVADRYGARVTPEVFLIDAKGVVRYHGAVDDSQDPENVQKSYLDDALKAFVAGQPVVTADTKAFGCSVQRVRK